MGFGSISIEDRLHILDLMARYNHLFEEGRAEEWAQTFVEDGEFSGPTGKAQGYEELANLCIETVQRLPVALHFTDHHLLERDGEKIKHRCLLSVQFPKEGGTGVLIYRYRDVLVRDGVEWKFESREVVSAETIGP